MSNPAIQNLVISLVGMQGEWQLDLVLLARTSSCLMERSGFIVARKIPFDDPDTLNIVRAGYVTVQLIIISTYYFISMKVRIQHQHTCQLVFSDTRVYRP